MLSFQEDNFVFNYRIAGIARHQDRILLHRSILETYWTLPGGRCEAGENSADALKREMLEELGAHVQVGPLRWVLENFFDYEGRLCHELGFVYDITLPSDFEHLDNMDTWVKDEDHSGLLFKWWPIDQLAQADLKPSALIDHIAQSPEHIVHLIHRD